MKAATSAVRSSVQNKLNPESIREEEGGGDLLNLGTHTVVFWLFH